MSNLEMYDINVLQFTDNSLKPASTEVMAKLNKVVMLFTTPTRHNHKYGNTNSYDFSQQQQHSQFQRMSRHQHGNTFNGGPWDGEEENNEIQITIKETKISILVGRSSHLLTRTDGEWWHVVTVANYKDQLSHYASLLCEEIIAGSK